MLRKLLTVVLPLMLPTLIYMAYMMIDRRKAAASGGAAVPWWVGAPWTWLVTGGVLLAAIVLVTRGADRRLRHLRHLPSRPPDRRPCHRRGNFTAFRPPIRLRARDARRHHRASAFHGRSGNPARLRSADRRWRAGAFRRRLRPRLAAPAGGQGYRHSDRCGAGTSYTAAGSGAHPRDPDRDRSRHHHRRHRIRPISRSRRCVMMSRRSDGTPASPSPTTG